MIYGPYSTGWKSGQVERRNAIRRAAWAWLGVVMIAAGAGLVVLGFPL